MASRPAPGSSGQSPAITALGRPGWLTFAAVVMFSVGVGRVISAIYYFADSNRVNNLTLGAFGGHLFLWGLWDLIIAAIAFWAGWSLLNGDAFGRVIGYLWAGVVLIQSFLEMTYAPWYGFVSAAVSLLVIYALSTTSSWTGSAEQVTDHDVSDPGITL
jgi:hypothetical protein